MAQKVINTNIDRNIALQAMQRLHSCYNNVLQIVRQNKVIFFDSVLTTGINPSGIVFP